LFGLGVSVANIVGGSSPGCTSSWLYSMLSLWMRGGVPVLKRTSLIPASARLLESLVAETVLSGPAS
jgi:hypothetical protein